MPTGMLVKPLRGPSTTYISVPITRVTISTKARKTAILRREAWIATERAELGDVGAELQDAEDAQQAQDAHVDQRIQLRHEGAR